jgi:murein L,D-transpeptidase YcbB/YkuD
MVAPPAQAVVHQPAAPAAAVSAPVTAPQIPPQPVATPAVEPAPRPVPMAAPVVAPPPVATPAVSEPPARVAAPGFTASDSEVANKVRELIGKKMLERIAPRKNERDAIDAFYVKNRNAMPLWFANGQLSERTRDAVAHLRGIDADGLDPADYTLPESATSVDAAAEAELRFTATILTYARHAMSGRVHFSRVSPNVDYKDNFDPADAMAKIAASTDLRRTLDGFNPQHPGYKALKAKYAEMRNQTTEPAGTRILQGPVLKYTRDKSGRETFMLDPRVPQLRERLGLPAAANNRYDRALFEAVAKYQKSNGITSSGQLTAATIDSLNGPSRQSQMDAILATMERWRWMPRNLGTTHVALNIPDFHLRVMNNGQQVWKTRVVVGKPSQATPLLTETMKFITVNPTWNVPQSIIYNELLPVYESSDPNIFARMGLSVERKPNGDVRVFQPPGERNALGRIRFNFPNKYLVYQHDTPEKHYFAHDKRAYSHGCMRVQDPMKYAEVLLSYAAPRGNHTAQSLQRMFGGEERQIDFAQHIPVHISYQTAFVDDNGKLVFRDDIYSLDKPLMAQLRGSERAVADVAIERPADPNFKPTAQHVQRMNSAARGGRPFSLFEQLFR